MKRLLIGARLRQWLGLSLLGAAVAAVLLVAPAIADSVVKGFSAQGTLKPGRIVALVAGSSTTVTASPSNSPSRIYGVVVDPSTAPLSLSRSGAQVYVATSGEYPVLVSSEAGSIKIGDYISIANIDGIGAKATTNQEVILGQAMSDFDGVHGLVTSASGEAIGQINVNINPGRSPVLRTASIPLPLSKIANAVAGRDVSPARIYGALGVFAIGALITSGILFVGVRSGIVAIGRNPLSRHSILIGLFQVIGVAILVFILDIFGVYLLLRL